MALQTRGFQSSQVPRAPRIPGNIGSVDVNEIVAGVKRGLEGFEAVRRAPKSMILADAQMDAATAEAPLGTRQLTAQTLATEQQLPYKTAILAAEASPEMLEARRTALLARAAPKPLTGVPYLLQRASELERAVQENPNDSVLAAALNDTRLQLSQARDIATAKAASAEQIAMGGNLTKEAISEKDRVSRTATSEADRISKEKIAAGNVAAKTIATEAKATAEKAKKAVVAKAQLEAINTRTDVIDRTIAEALPKINGLTAGFAGSKLSQISGTEATNVRRLLDTVKANIGFEELNNLRAQSATGGALGNITVEELRFLQSVQGSLEQDQEPAQLKRNLEVILARFRELRAKKQEAFEEEYGIPFNPPAVTLPTAPAPTSEFKIVEIK